MATITLKTLRAVRVAGAPRFACAWLLGGATLLLGPAALAADSAPPSAPAGKQPAVTLESISGSTVKRVVLSAKAAERLGIETGRVGEDTVVLKQMVGGLVTAPVNRQPGTKPGGSSFGGFAQGGESPPPRAAASVGDQAPDFVAAVAATTPAGFQSSGRGFGGFGKAIAAPAPQPVAAAEPAPASTQANAPLVGDDAWVLVTLSPGEWERLAKDKPARLLTLSTRDKLGTEVLARPSGLAPVEDAKRSMLTVYYVVPGRDHGLALNSRMRVELQIDGDDEKHKVVPYSAVYYDGKGTAWVYVNTRPLTFERQRIGVDRVVGNVAVLSDGPPVGTPVVTVGAALLFGAEVFGK